MRRPHADRVDLLAIALDDTLLDLLAVDVPDGREAPVAADHGAGEDRLTRMLAAWRDELRARPLPARPSCDEAVRAVAPDRRRRSTRPMVAAAAAITALLIASAVVGSRTAQPGDALFPVTQALWADRADAAVAGQQVRSALDDAEAALRAGNTRGAAEALATAVRSLAGVRDAQAQQTMQQEIIQLWGKVAAADPTADLGDKAANPAPGTAADLAGLSGAGTGDHPGSGGGSPGAGQSDTTASAASGSGTSASGDPTPGSSSTSGTSGSSTGPDTSATGSLLPSTGPAAPIPSTTGSTTPAPSTGATATPTSPTPPTTAGSTSSGAPSTTGSETSGGVSTVPSGSSAPTTQADPGGGAPVTPTEPVPTIGSSGTTDPTTSSLYFGYMIIVPSSPTGPTSSGTGVSSTDGSSESGTSATSATSSDSTTDAGP